MDIDDNLSVLGIESDTQVILYEDCERLREDIERSEEFMSILQDDEFASRLNAHLQIHIVRGIDTPEFVHASYGHIGEMIANLRGKGESYLVYHNARIGVDRLGQTDDLDSYLRSVGWRTASDDEVAAMYKAPNLVRGR